MSEDRFASALAAAVVVRPGETLVLAFDRRLSMAEVDELTERVKGYLPEGAHVVITDGGVSIGVVRA